MCGCYVAMRTMAENGTWCATEQHIVACVQPDDQVTDTRAIVEMAAAEVGTRLLRRKIDATEAWKLHERTPAVLHACRHTLP